MPPQVESCPLVRTPTPDAGRFGGIARLYGQDGLARLARAHACVIGIGGVGTWAAEALARSGVGRITLVDLDEICLTNTNRQLHAVEGQYGKPKVEAMAERIKHINPACQVRADMRFFSERTAEGMLDTQPDVVLDCIDSLKAKILLVAECWRRDIPCVVSGGAGGKIDPTQICKADLNRSHGDNLLMFLRKRLRQQHADFPRSNRLLGIPCVFSPEPRRYPTACGDIADAPEADAPRKLDCSEGFGAAAHITGTFGLWMAGAALDLILESQSMRHQPDQQSCQHTQKN